MATDRQWTYLVGFIEAVRTNATAARTVAGDFGGDGADAVRRALEAAKEQLELAAEHARAAREPKAP